MRDPGLRPFVIGILTIGAIVFVAGHYLLFAFTNLARHPFTCAPIIVLSPFFIYFAARAIIRYALYTASSLR